METLEHNPNEAIPYDNLAAIRLHTEAVQEIMNRLWMLGVRPAERMMQNTQEINILRDEVTYLRTLVQRLTNAPPEPH